jgi:hypothetical protein
MHTQEAFGPACVTKCKYNSLLKSVDSAVKVNMSRNNQWNNDVVDGKHCHPYLYFKWAKFCLM